MKKFKKIYIEITNRCNLACSFCQPTNRPRAFMHPDAFEEILGRISGHTDHVSLHVLGEPLLHPSLGLLLDKCHNHGLRVNLTTNGTLLSRNGSILLGQPALRQVNISLHSFEQPENDAALDAYLESIFVFIAATRSVSPVFINLRLWNRSPVPQTEKHIMNQPMLRRLEDHFKLSLPLDEDTVPTGRGIPVAPQVFLSMEHSFTWPHGSAPDLGSQGFCRGLRDHIAILVDGTLVPCCLDGEGDIPLGNIFQFTLADILAGPRAIGISEGFSRQRITDPLCRRCTYRQRFQHENRNRPGTGRIQATLPVPG